MTRHGPLDCGDEHDRGSEGTSCHLNFRAGGGEGEPPPMMTMLRCGSARAALLGKRICANQGEGADMAEGVLSGMSKKSKRSKEANVPRSVNDG